MAKRVEDQTKVSLFVYGYYLLPSVRYEVFRHSRGETSKASNAPRGSGGRSLPGVERLDITDRSNSLLDRNDYTGERSMLPFRVMRKFPPSVVPAIVKNFNLRRIPGDSCSSFGFPSLVELQRPPVTASYTDNNKNVSSSTVAAADEYDLFIRDSSLPFVSGFVINDVYVHEIAMMLKLQSDSRKPGAFSVFLDDCVFRDVTAYIVGDRRSIVCKALVIKPDSREKYTAVFDMASITRESQVEIASRISSAVDETEAMKSTSKKRAGFQRLMPMMEKRKINS
jgi:hypothetical protein